jgi:hypothetical protein
MDLLSTESAEDWRRGRISYLERVIRCNLSQASRILSILRMHAHDLDLKPSLTVYKRWTKGSRPLLWFSKTGDHNIEQAYVATLSLHARRAVHLKKERSRIAILRRSRKYGGPARDEKFRKAKSKVRESRRKHDACPAEGGKKLQRYCIDESLIHDGHMWSACLLPGMARMTVSRSFVRIHTNECWTLLRGA